MCISSCITSISTISYSICIAAQAPRKPRTSLGEMVNYYLTMEPHLFKEAVSTQFERIKEEREAAAEAARERQKNAPPASSDKSDLVLYRCPHCLPHQDVQAPDNYGCTYHPEHTGTAVRGHSQSHLRVTSKRETNAGMGIVCRRMEEVKRNEQRATVEDLMYASVLEKFVEVGVDMMPTLDSITESQETLKVWAACSPQPCCHVTGGVIPMRFRRQGQGPCHTNLFPCGRVRNLLCLVCLPAAGEGFCPAWKGRSQAVPGRRP